MTDKAKLLALALRCEQATGPDRELDAQIAPVQGLRVVDEGHPIGRMCYDDIGSAQLMPRYTASLDSAMTLVPEGWGFSVRRLCDGRSSATAYAPCTGNGLFHAATPALALTAAALRALASEQPA